VKNVAGYDLGRLMSGSFGTLAAIVDATFKLLPVPAASRTMVAPFGDAASLARAVACIVDSDLEPVAFDVHVIVPRGEYWLVVRFATSPAATEAQISAAQALLDPSTRSARSGQAASSGGGLAPSGVVSDSDEEMLWRDHQHDIWKPDGVVVRLSWLPASLEEVLSLLTRVAADSGVSLELAARAGVGAGFVRIAGDARAQIAAIEQLRARADVATHIVVLRAANEVKQHVDVWGRNPQLESVYRSLKHTLDPEGILNAGRGPV
jgi:glycolate oxidase FAD binding subunit